jgi:hypothetical protein
MNIKMAVDVLKDKDLNGAKQLKPLPNLQVLERDK